jgi:ABC-type multidrug transport system fused ATPase/permease subunit
MFSTEAEAKMNAVERVMEYGELKPEAPLYVPHSTIDKSWPRKGSLTFKNVHFRYRPDLPPALKNLSFSVQSGSRVGVVGRTGSGKSTLAVALFRIVELESGSISVDGVNLKNIGLADVRGRSLCIIPQGAVLCFTETCILPFLIFSALSLSLAIIFIDL